MNQMLPRPRFWADAAAQLQSRFSLLGELLIFFLLYFIATFLQSLLVAIPVSGWVLGTERASIFTSLTAGASVEAVILELFGKMPDWLYLVSLGATAVYGLAAIFYCRRFQKRSLASMGLRGPKPLGECALGLVSGLALFGLVVALGTAMGGFRLTADRPDGSRIALCLLALLGCVIQGGALELLFRGYFAPTIGSRAPVVFTLIVTTLASSMTQGSGTLLSMGAVNGLLLSLLLGIWVIKRGSLWGACTLHGAWTFAAAFLFDFAPAGEHGSLRLFDLDVDTFRPLLSGGEYGPMESICVTLVLLAAVAAALALKPKDPWAGPERPPEETGNNL